MSGRKWHTQADGRRTLGSRKTLVQRARRTPAHLLPDWTLSIVLPTMIAWTLKQGPYPGVLGVHVVCSTTGLVEIKGKTLKWVRDTADAFMQDIGRKHGIASLNYTLARPAEHGPTLSGPGYPAKRSTGELRYQNGRSSVVDGFEIRAIRAA